MIMEHPRKKDIVIGTKRFVCGKGKVVDTLFNENTASGYFVRVPHGIEFYDIGGTLFAFCACGPNQSGFFVSARKTGNFKRYQYSTSHSAEEKLGLVGLSYSEVVELGRKLDALHKNQN